jgi:hypothetical protein
MLFKWVTLFVFSAIICQLYIKSRPLGWLVYSIVILTSITYVYRLCYSSHDCSVQYTPQQVYHILKHGDVMNMRRVYSPVLELPVMFFNDRYAHCSLIIEEDGVKYVVEALPKKPILSEYVLTTKPSLMVHPTWYITKTPLMNYLLVYPMHSYRIYRPPVLPTFKLQHDDYHGPTPRLLFCSVYIARIMERNGLIPSSNKLIPYRTDELLAILADKGYTSFTFVC